jgi:hypothetical protein
MAGITPFGYILLEFVVSLNATDLIGAIYFWITCRVID